jgi:hypothetical protein
MKKFFLAVLILFATISVYSQSTKPRVGILDFVGNNISDSDTLVVGDMFTSELVLSGEYDVVDRKNIESIMTEMDFQMSGCTDSSCALEIGQILSLDKMLYGSINKLGKDYIINIYMIDIETAQIESSARERFGSIEDSYDIMGILIAKLIGGSSYKAEDTARTDGSGAQAGGAAPVQAVSLPASSDGGLSIEAAVGGVVGDSDSGIEIEGGVLYMFNGFWGIGGSLLLGNQFGDAMFFGIGLRVYFELMDDFGLAVGFRGFPSYINSFGGLCASLYFGDFYLRGGIQLIAGAGFNVDVGYKFNLY